MFPLSISRGDRASGLGPARPLQQAGILPQSRHWKIVLCLLEFLLSSSPSSGIYFSESAYLSAGFLGGSEQIGAPRPAYTERTGPAPAVTHGPYRLGFLSLCWTRLPPSVAAAQLHHPWLPPPPNHLRTLQAVGSPPLGFPQLWAAGGAAGRLVLVVEPRRWLAPCVQRGDLSGDSVASAPSP